MRKTNNQKFISLALAAVLAAVTVLGAPFTAFADSTELTAGHTGSETAFESAEATPSDAGKTSSAGEADFPFLFVTSEEGHDEAAPSDVKMPKQASLQTGKAAGAKAKIDGTEYDTVQEAIEAAADGVSTTITMLEDSEENLDISNQKIIVLDLAGHVLSAPEAGGRVIDNRGGLTVKDSAPAVPHYFDYDTDGNATLNPAATDGDTLDEITESTTSVKLTGGCITGGCIAGGYAGDSNGGAILNRTDSSLTVTGCNIVGNAATAGGGIYISYGSTAVLTDTVIFANTTEGDGGALYLDSGKVGDPAVPKVGQAILERVFLTGNHAERGGAVTMIGFSRVLMKDCRVTANSAEDQGGGIYKPNVGDDGVKCVLLNTEITGNTAGNHGGGIYFYYKNSCFAAGTLITMADGSVRNIEDITEGDAVKTFDHETGKISSARVYYAYKGDTKAAPITLTFDDGRSLSIAGCHDLLEKESRKYVTVSEADAETFVGSSFYGEDGKWHTLLSVAKESDPCDYYSIYTAVHQNCFANGLLSVPDDTDCMLNLYELDENLKADEEQLASDIAEFGLYSFEDAKALRNVSRDWYDAAGGRYLNIVIGKGLLTLEESAALFDSVGGAGAEEADDVPSARADSGVETFLSAALNILGGLFVLPAYAGELSAAAPTFDSYNKNVLTIGKGTIITGNTSGTSDPSADNVYLVHNVTTEEGFIELTEGSHEGIRVGVTMEKMPSESEPSVQFTTSGDHMSKADEAHFFSDNTDYTDRFNSENNCMELILASRCYIDANKNGQLDSGEICYKYVQDAVTDAGTTEQTVIRMTDDSEENVAIATGQDIILDLNGHVLSAPVTGGSVIDNRGKLTVTDSDPTVPHYFDYSDTAAWTWNPAATDGDTLDEITESTTSVKLTGGCITGGTGHSTGSYLVGGGIYDYSTGLVLHAGNIVGNTADNGGGILSCHLTMDGGTVVGNAAGSQGGGIYSVYSLEMTGGKISGNTAPLGGGVTFGESITLGGTANITGNTFLDGTAADNVHLPDGKTITVSTTTVPVAKDPQDSSKAYMLVGVRTETAPVQGSPVAVTGTNGADYHGSFIADDTSYGIQNGTDNVVMVYLGLPMTFIAEIPDHTYTGSAIEPEITVMSGTTTLIRNTDYTVSYENNINVGTATVTVVAQGMYSGTKTVHFNIVTPTPGPTPKPEPEPQPEPEKDDVPDAEATNILLTPSTGGTWAHVTGSNDWYYIRANGTTATGWLLDGDGSWYYLEKAQSRNPGALQTGWLTDPDDGYRYYLDPVTGKMLTGWAVIDGKKYYFNETVPGASGWTQNAAGDWVYSRHNVTPLGALIEQ